MATFNLTAMGKTATGGAVLRIRNETGDEQEFRLVEVGRDGVEIVTDVPPGDYFVEVKDFGTYKLFLGAASKTKSAGDPDKSSVYGGPIDYREGDGPICFAAGTPILTLVGDLPVEEIRRGDRVLCQDGCFHEVLWTGHIRVDGRGDFAPVRFRNGALGNRQDVSFSPAHRVRIADWKAEILFGHQQVLAAARDLVGMPGVERVPQRWVDYHHILLEDHQMVASAGLWTETLHPYGALETLDSAARAEVLALFPELTDDATAAPRRLRHPALNAAEVSRLASYL
ncbi:MAG: Hint domain-containing protein [Pseudomonadota bacterium]